MHLSVLSLTRQRLSLGLYEVGHNEPTSPVLTSSVVILTRCRLASSLRIFPCNLDIRVFERYVKLIVPF